MATPSRRRTKARPTPRPAPAPGTKAKVKELDVKAGEKLLKAGLKELPDEFFVCRDIRHKWDITQDYHEVPYSHAGRKLQALRRVLTCGRCGGTRVQHFLNGRYGLTKLSDVASRPPGYSIHGVPRGVKHTSIIQQESYRRAMERATGAPRGARATAER